MATFKPLPPKEALEYWAGKKAVTAKEFYKLEAEARAKAFTVSGVNRLDQVQALQESLEQALKNGTAFSEWKKHAEKIVGKGYDEWPHKLDNVFRTNVQSAYQVGRYKQMMEVVEDRPFWQYSAVCDRRTRPSHLALHGRVVRADDPFWDTYYPPNGFRCRCTVKTLSEGQVERRGLSVESPKTGDMLGVQAGTMKGWELPLQPDKHFGGNPAKSVWQPDLKRYRADIKQKFLEALTGLCPESFVYADFSDSPCLMRLKKHLTQMDFEDLQTVIWAKNKQVEQGFGQWLDTVNPQKSRGELYPVGNLPSRVLRYLGKKGISPRLSLITLTDAEVGHMLRDIKVKRRAVLTLDEIKQLPRQIKNGRWWFDHQKANCLLSWVRTASEGIWLKMAMELDYKIFNKKGLVANSIRTTGVIKSKDMLKNERYEEIF